MIELFLIALLGTFIVTRIGAHLGNDPYGYGVNDKSKTITAWMRRKTGFDWHHIHIGLALFLLSIIFIYFRGFTNFNTIFLGAGFSMIID